MLFANGPTPAPFDVDPSSVTVEYRGGGSREWRPLPPQPPAGSHTWGAAEGLDAVRVRAADRAGNRADGTVTVVR